MPSSKRTDSPAPKASSRQVDSPGSKGGTVRKQTRPMGEFYGNIGTGFWTFFIPLAIYYFYGIMVMHQGRLVIPTLSFWRDLWYLPDGISIRPCWGPTLVSLTWVCCQALGEMILPGKMKEGVMLKNGRKLLYPMNGLLCFGLSHVGLFLLCWYGVLEPYYVFSNMGALLTEAVITSFVLALWLYIDFGIFWKRHVDDPEFEEDHGVFKYKDFFNDFFMGVVRNPRLFHGILKVPFDLKRFWNARPGLTGWVILNISYLASMYYGCGLPSAYAAGDSLFFGDHDEMSAKIMETFKPFNAPGASFCKAEGSWDNIGLAALFITAAHWYYILDYNMVEPAYLTTTDIRHDLFGFMLTYGDWGFLSRFYPISFMGFLAWQGGSGYITKNPVFVAIGIALYFFGMTLFRITNIEKHLFRDHINNGGTVDKYRSPWSTRIVFGDKKAEFIRTKEGSILLTSGYWGLARHFNYIGDLTMCIGWAVACYDPTSPFPWLPISYCIYFWLMDCHRCWRDEVRCSKKYGADWERYKQAVPYYIFPGIW